jgi:hypothetical protein
MGRGAGRAEAFFASRQGSGARAAALDSAGATDYIPAPGMPPPARHRVPARWNRAESAA